MGDPTLYRYIGAGRFFTPDGRVVDNPAAHAEAYVTPDEARAALAQSVASMRGGLGSAPERSVALSLPGLRLTFREDRDGHFDARLGIDAATVRSAPGGEFLRVEHHAVHDQALLLDLTLQGLRLLQPLIEGRHDRGIERSVSREVLGQEPRQRDIAVEVGHGRTASPPAESGQAPHIGGAWLLHALGRVVREPDGVRWRIVDVQPSPTLTLARVNPDGSSGQHMTAAIDSVWAQRLQAEGAQ